MDASERGPERCLRTPPEGAGPERERMRLEGTRKLPPGDDEASPRQRRLPGRKCCRSCDALSKWRRLSRPGRRCAASCRAPRRAASPKRCGRSWRRPWPRAACPSRCSGSSSGPCGRPVSLSLRPGLLRLPPPPSAGPGLAGEPAAGLAPGGSRGRSVSGWTSPRFSAGSRRVQRAALRPPGPRNTASPRLTTAAEISVAKRDSSVTLAPFYDLPGHGC